MPASITMTNKQHVGAGISIVDQDGQPFATLPPGVNTLFSSDHPEIANFVVGPDGMNGDVTSGLVGSAIITASVTGLTPEPISDTLAVAIINSAPGSANFTVGTPVEE